MKTNKKLKLNTKKVVILSNEQQDSVQGGFNSQRCEPDFPTKFCSLRACSQLPPPYSCI